MEYVALASRARNRSPLAQGRLSDTLMANQNLLCCSCGVNPASMFCMCQAAGILLCASCPHCDSSLPHSTYPIQAYPFRTVPNYFTRLSHRLSFIPTASHDLLARLSVIDCCIAELKCKAETVISAIRQYAAEETEKLQRLKAAMQTEVEQAIAEVERTLYEDEPVLMSKYGPRLRMGKPHSLVCYRIVSSPKVALELMISSEGKAAECCIFPQVSGTTLRRYNMNTGHTSSAPLSTNFNYSAFSLLDEDTLLCAGGSPVTAAAWLLHISEATISQLPRMKAARCDAALIKHGAAYVFGGHDGRNLLRMCEKFVENSWTQLPSMHYPRTAFCACSLGDLIFLPCMNFSYASGVLETFSVSAEVFKTHPVTLPNLGNCNSVSFVVEGELFILAGGQMCRLHLNTETAFRLCPIDMREKDPLSNIQPVLYGREVFWASYFSSGDLRQFSLDSLVFTSY